MDDKQSPETAPTQPPKGGANTSDLVPVQLSLLKDVQDQTLQTRFERFCEEAAQKLCEVNPNGDPIFEAGKVESEMTITVKVYRTSDTEFNFGFSHATKVKHPTIPGKVRSGLYHRTRGMVQRIKPDTQLPMFNPDEGQPVMHDDDSARQTLAPD